MFQTLNVPLEASQIAIKQGLLNELRVYLSLKFQADNGQIRTSNIDYDRLSELSGFQDKRTIEKHLETLLSLNWIGKDNRWTFIRSFERIRKTLSAESRTAVEIRPKDVQHIKEFILGAKIGHSARAKRYARKKPGAKPITKQPSGEPFKPENISCSLIAEWFGYSRSTASRMKQRAKKAGYLNYRHHFQNLGLSKADLSQFTKVMGIDFDYICFKRGKPCLRLTDEFIIGKNGFHEFAFKTRCKL